MTHYRVYTLKDGNHIAGPPVVIECASDNEAIREAKKRLEGLDIEVWEGARCVTRLRPAEARQDIE